MRTALVSFFLMTIVGFAEETAVGSFKEIAKELPKDSVLASNGKSANLRIGAIDVRRTPSVMKPVVGTIDFKLSMVIIDTDVEMDLRLEFTWKNGKWTFDRLMNQRTRKDITNLPLGQDIMGKGPLHDFLARYRP